MREKLLNIRKEAEKSLLEAIKQQDIERLRINFLGKKGKLTQLLRGMGNLLPEDRPVIGQMANKLRSDLERMIEEKIEAIKEKEKLERLEKEQIDVTITGRKKFIGRKHPLTRTLEDIKSFFIGMGYEVVEGPEIELDYYNFEALNTPEDHPARDVQDTFYITDKILLRTQTSPMQVRTMEKRKPPLKILAPGRVYRSDAVDATHSPVFHQVEGLVIDENITMGDLKGTLIAFARYLFGQDRGVRFRPHYFPFTEPSAELDISCIVCNGKGCRLCSYNGWLEILGCGMVHPRVLEMVGYNPEKVGGFALGMGIERIALLKYGIDDMRLFFENDLRFLRQF
ncbi:MAG: phenylalanyl-tRNA synthetase alpha chain [Thermosediminibacterales bacterium]|nr:phenylalanyl-tRNA synthetase alpha chain [Thermosediminibacterales bacterium]MDK2835469.1 phenylalanyl-tRNA synthetase alpha chain [Thermosediminibacterales bacterium]